MPDDGADVDRIAATTERLGMISPDLRSPAENETDEIVVVIHIAGGLLADVGVRRSDIPRLRIVVLDDDNCEASDGEEGAWTETPTALEAWARGEDAVLPRAVAELPEKLRREFGLVESECLAAPEPPHRGGT